MLAEYMLLLPKASIWRQKQVGLRIFSHSTKSEKTPSFNGGQFSEGSSIEGAAKRRPAWIGQADCFHQQVGD